MGTYAKDRPSIRVFLTCGNVVVSLLLRRRLNSGYARVRKKDGETLKTLSLFGIWLI